MQSHKEPLITSIQILAVIGTILLVGTARADFIFGTPENLGATVNSVFLEGMFDISRDGLELFFESNRPGGQGDTDIWVVRRKAIADPWSSPQNLEAPVNGTYADSSPCLTTDGLSLYFTSKRPGGAGGSDIYVATRVTINDPWEEPVNLGPAVNSSAFEAHQSISGDGLSLFFGSNRDKLGTAFSGYCYIYMTTRTTLDAPWGMPVRLEPIVNSALEHDSDWPSISDDGLSLFFRHWSPEEAALWVVTRTSVSDSWNHAVNLGFKGVTPRILADQSIMYFTSRAFGGYGDADLFEVSFNPIVDFNNDELIDLVDLEMLISNWNTDDQLYDIGPMPWGDGIVDIEDLKVFIKHWEEANAIESDE